jgi:hypothetical protein
VFELGPLPRRRSLQIPGPERSSGPLSRKNALLSALSHLPPHQWQRAGSAVSRLTFAADAGGQPGLVLSAVAGIAPVLMDQMGAGALSRPARRRPEFTARAAAPAAPIGACLRVGPVRPGAWMPRPAGGGLLALPVQGRIGPAERTGLRLACSRMGLTRCLAAGIGRVTLLIT